jgi:predicted acylesterase/phospholipase RssA
MRRVVLLLLLAFTLGACATIARVPAPPVETLEEVSVLGIRHARFLPDGPPGPMLEAAREARARAVGRTGPRHFLAISGGGDDGAFGAGVLEGWTARGDRPEFDVVTGISAGALIAPFAFLGPAYDPALRSVFRDVRPTDLLLLRRILGALLFDDSLADTSPLYRLIARHADEDMLRAIAAEHARGRLLLIGTTNLDAQRPVVWNMGAIAASGHPGALNLFRQILLASASIPGAFPPVMINVEQGGRRFQEMHVDGGAVVQIFLYPPSLVLPAEGQERWVHALRNGRTAPMPNGAAERGLFSISTRAVRTLLHHSGVSDIQRLYLVSQRDGMRFRLARIAPEFTAERREPFDPGYMRALYAHGVEFGRSGAGWLDAPPVVGR